MHPRSGVGTSLNGVGSKLAHERNSRSPCKRGVLSYARPGHWQAAHCNCCGRACGWSRLVQPPPGYTFTGASCAGTLARSAHGRNFEAQPRCAPTRRRDTFRSLTEGLELNLLAGVLRRYRPEKLGRHRTRHEAASALVLLIRPAVATGCVQSGTQAMRPSQEMQAVRLFANRLLSSRATPVRRYNRQPIA
ncbi:MAG: hypothetical protein JWR53_757 [Glaciihabitans sp.]|nr:hypothetical protein [Glaciihabitans sp.]